jgi:hypothetical protein
MSIAKSSTLEVHRINRFGTKIVQTKTFMRAQTTYPKTPINNEVIFGKCNNNAIAY